MLLLVVIFAIYPAWKFGLYIGALIGDVILCINYPCLGFGYHTKNNKTKKVAVFLKKRGCLSFGTTFISRKKANKVTNGC